MSRPRHASPLLSTVLVLIGLCWLTPAMAKDTFENPIITGMNPDPSIVRVGDDYYLVTSTFEYFPGLPIYHSRDLVHWNKIGHALNTPTANPLMGADSSTGGQYAAVIRHHQGTFYVIGTCYSPGQPGGQSGVFYVTAKNPAGPWSEPTWLHLWHVDPSLLFLDDKVYYLSPDNKGSFLLGELDVENGRFIVEPKKIAEGLGGSSPEGPHLYKVGEYYYLMSAEGGTGYEHREVIQRSKSPWGPYEPSPHNPLITHHHDPDNPFHAIGHADLVETPDGWWLVCLGIRPRNGRFQHLGRETFLTPVTWGEDGWPRVGEDGIVRQTYPFPNLPRHEWEKPPVRDDFDSQTLGLDWNFLRNPNDNDWSLTQRPGYLRLNGSAINFSTKDSPAFVARRQTGFDVDLSTQLSFEPTADNEEAGLVVRGNDKNYYKFVITRHDGRRVIQLQQYLKDEIAGTIHQPIADGDAILRITSTDLEYKFWIQFDGGQQQLIGVLPTRHLANEVIWGFTGVYIGMYASGNGSANTNPADFAWSDYVGGR